MKRFRNLAAETRALIAVFLIIGALSIANPTWGLLVAILFGAMTAAVSPQYAPFGLVAAIVFSGVLWFSFDTTSLLNVAVDGYALLSVILAFAGGFGLGTLAPASFGPEPKKKTEPLETPRRARRVNE